MSPPIPLTAGEIDAPWVEEALTPRHPGVRVSAVDLVEKHEVTNAHARLRITYDEPAGAPDLLFLKLPPTDPARRVTINRTGMGLREARFYDLLADQVGMRTPRVHAAIAHEDDGTFALLLEDLVSAGCVVSDGPVGVPIEAAAKALEDLADLHARFQDPARRAAEAPWVPVLPYGSTYGSDMLQYGLDHHRDKLTDEFAAVAQLYIDHGRSLYDLWHAGPQTVIHGDPHIGNLFFDRGTVGFLDWGIVNVNTPMRDVGYFLTMSLTVTDRRAHERDLLRHYLEVLAARGFESTPTWNEAWLAHRIHAGYCVPASCQVVLFPENQGERRRIFAEAFLGRASAAVADLEAEAALVAGIDSSA